MTNNYEQAKKEVMFVLIPFLVLLIIRVLQEDIEALLVVADYSLATSIVWGQLLAKTLDVPDVVKKKGAFSTKQVQIFLFSILSLTLYISLNLIESVAEWVYWGQLVWFIFSVLYYVPVSSLMNNLSKLPQSK